MTNVTITLTNEERHALSQALISLETRQPLFQRAMANTLLVKDSIAQHDLLRLYDLAMISGGLAYDRDLVLGSIYKIDPEVSQKALAKLERVERLGSRMGGL